MTNSSAGVASQISAAFLQADRSVIELARMLSKAALDIARPIKAAFMVDDM
jgi:hypothetical protein